MRSRPFLFLLIVLLLLSAAAGATYIQPTTTTTTSPPVRIVTIAVKPTTTTPAISGLSVESTPEGAVVIIDGINRGKTPVLVRPLAAGTHSVIVTLDGYGDVAERVRIAPGSFTRVSYALVPVTTVPTTTPIPVQTIRVVTPTPVPARTRVPVQNMTAEFRLPRTASILPLTVSAGNYTHAPFIDTSSPYFRFQLAGVGGALPGPADPRTNLTTILEVDSMNVYLPQSGLMSSAEMTLDPVWGDEDTVYIDVTDKHFNNTNFRWITNNSRDTAFFQVSRYPFDSNASRWQNEFVPGLIGSGPAKDVYVDSDGFHYFSLDFARVAGHNPSDPPFYTGVAKLDETVPGKGKPMGLMKVPVANLGIWTKKAVIGPVTVPVPGSIEFLPAGELIESELGNPNSGMILSDTAFLRPSTSSETAIASQPRTFYVRVVPIHPDGSAGVPAIPVTVTVLRPEPCPEHLPPDTVQEIVVKPPSVTIASFYMTSFIPDWIHTDQDGKLVSRAYFVTVAPDPACSAAPTGNSLLDQANAMSCSMHGGNQPGYHFYADPAETHWYDTVWDIITGLFSAFGEVIHAVSSAWNQIKAAAVQIAAQAVTVLTAGAFDCSSSPACTDLLNTGLNIAMSSLGVPPTIPDIADLESMGADYMARVAAEELGAGGVLDTAQGVYNSIPADAQQEIKQNAGSVGKDVANSIVSQTGAATAAAGGGNFYIPDPLYYEPHPAMVMVKVYNPNPERTTPASLTVKDSADLFRTSEGIYVPALGPGESTVIPVILRENYTKVYTEDCSRDSYTSICGDICVPCYWNLWYFAVIDSSNNGGDTFSATLTGPMGTDLSQPVSGKVLTNQDTIYITKQGKSCGAYNHKTVLKSPEGWQIRNDGLTQDLWSQCWLKYSFTEGAKGRLIGG